MIAGPLASREGGHIVLPGLATAHSHAFQRALRGRTQRRSSQSASFWSWRALMYELAGRLDPESIYDVSRLAYAELAMAGVTAVGEFHYVHHQRDGTPYDDRIALADAVVRAARDVGLRITLLRVIYERAGAGRPPEGAQRRFADASIDDALADIDAVATRFAGDPCVAVGIAPHSVRAVSRESIAAASAHASRRALPLHMHVAEQRRELAECVAEHGMPPVRMLATDGVLGPRFVAVHATHLEPDEITALGEAGAFACICRTTERDLGDGSCDSAALVSAGVRLCTGVDSHALSDPFEEARAIELDDRTRAEARNVAADPDALLRAATVDGYEAIGMTDCTSDRVRLSLHDPALAGASDALLEDAVIYAGSPRAVEDVEVDGELIVENGRHRDLDEITTRYRRTLARLL